MICWTEGPVIAGGAWHCGSATSDAFTEASRMSIPSFLSSPLYEVGRTVQPGFNPPVQFVFPVLPSRDKVPNSLFSPLLYKFMYFQGS